MKMVYFNAEGTTKCRDLSFPMKETLFCSLNLHLISKTTFHFPTHLCLLSLESWNQGPPAGDWRRGREHLKPPLISDCWLWGSTGTDKQKGKRDRVARFTSCANSPARNTKSTALPPPTFEMGPAWDLVRVLSSGNTRPTS